MNECGVNKRNGIASLIQLEAKSTLETEYMYSFDKENRHPLLYANYQQHTQYDREPVIIEYTHSFTKSKLIHYFDNTMSDMIGNFFIRIQVPELAGDNDWCNNLGHSLIKSIRILNEDEEMAYFTGEYLHILYKLDTKQSKMRGVDEMIQHYSSQFSLNGKSKMMYIEIPFLKCNEDVQFFPIFTGQKTLSMHIELNSIRELIRTVSVKQEHVNCDLIVQTHSDTCKVVLNYVNNILPESQLKIGIMYDSITLCKEERLLFLTKTNSILFKQVQYREIDMGSNSIEQKINIDFNHNVTELIIVLSLEDATNQKFQFRPLSGISIHLNGIDIKNNVQKNRFMNKHHRIPNTHVYVVPFCMDNTINQPTGTYSFDKDEHNVNKKTKETNTLHHALLFKEENLENETGSFSNLIRESFSNLSDRISFKNNELKVYRTDKYQHEKAVLKIFAISYNVLRINGTSVSIEYLL